MRKWLLTFFKRASQPLWGRGISRTLPVVGKFYDSIYRRLSPSGRKLFEVQGLKIYAEARTEIALILGIRSSYEEETTKLFYEIVREGMTVLDLGANIGYYSLIAASKVGEKGKVFAFEPWSESFSILQSNIEVNGFKNIIPVAKAVSNRCGRQRLFLAKDPSDHSLVEFAGNESVEVDITSIDEFVREQRISIDLIKIDVEGAEMKVLEGMAETIVKNPDMKIITEFSAHNLERSGCSPSVFLQTLMDSGFKLYLIDDTRHKRERINLNNMDDVIKASRNNNFSNIYCDKAVEQGPAT